MFVNSAGVIGQQIEYHPYGEERIIVGTNTNNYRFTGKEHDSETGEDYFGARYYASNFGRFLTPDWAATPVPIPYAIMGNPQTLNLYSYVQNNPITGTDPDGHADQGAQRSYVGDAEGYYNCLVQNGPSGCQSNNSTQQEQQQHQQGQKPKAKPKPKPQHKSKPLVKANPPINKAQNKAAASQEVDYFAVTANGNQSTNHVVGLSENFTTGPHPDAHICSPSCTTKNPALIHQGEFEDLQMVYAGESYSVERRWSVDGQPAEVLDPKNNAFDYEILHQSTDTNPPFQIEYKNDPNQ